MSMTNDGVANMIVTYDSYRIFQLQLNKNDMIRLIDLHNLIINISKSDDCKL